VLLDMRARWEEVQQDGLAKTADGVTLRTRLGYETGEYEHFKALVEFQDVRGLARDSFNNTFNGRTRFPTIGDGSGTTLDRAQLTYTGLSKTTIIGGRQRILINNQRFIGNAGFRQREQTFDGVTVNNKSIPNLDLTYGWIRPGEPRVRAEQRARQVRQRQPSGERDLQRHQRCDADGLQ